MYKIFFKDREIVLTDRISEDLSSHFGSILKYANKGELAQFIDNFDKDENIKSAFVYYHNLRELMQQFRSCFKNLPAAGGLVWNEQKTAFIGMKRLGFFDLPKGKVEKHETHEDAAIREVEEECNIQDLTILSKAITTYHTYKLKGENILKETHWYEMIYHGSAIPRPQTEENIESVFWVRPDELAALLKTTYPSIIEVLKSSSVRLFDFDDHIS
ncbi:MAG TPA: NUDIX hydrolase [Marinilabiliaceae bacterium]|jgi:8-oxo-dGTP pyrophosphatase MutT (NUDIX family)|nr:NUDIX hydrolase [Marinilabiliaceae bacterium]HBX88938.1 NUDIX hydrolase [Marinilabiliaceae bacterium]